jgi:hypothetical protein
MNGRALLREMAEAYAASSSYSDHGLVTTTFIRPGGREPRANPALTAADFAPPPFAK